MWYIWIIVLLFLITIYNKLTTGKCYEDTIMTGKVAIVTGGSRGIGFQTAFNLARLGAKVIIAARNENDGHSAVQTIIKTTGNKHVEFMKLDMSSLASVRDFVETFKQQGSKLDILINNTGVNCTDRKRSADGIIRGMQVNHYGPFLLTVLLIPVLKSSAPSRVINVTSSLYRFGKTENVNAIQSYFQTYCNSSLCKVLFTRELAKKLVGTGVVANCLEPGFVNTDFYKGTFLEILRKLFLFLFFKHPEDGAQTSIYLAISQDWDTESGKYFVDCKPREVCSKVINEDTAVELWNSSEELVGLRPKERIEL